MQSLGYTNLTFEFFRSLGDNNNRTWWLAHKDQYDLFVATPTKAIMQELEIQYGPAHFFRANRDIRFSHDKSPYKLNASFSIGGPAGTGMYFEVSTNGVFFGGGMYEPRPDQLQKWRELFKQPKAIDEIKKFLKQSEKFGLTLSYEMEVKTAPRGWDKTHPEIDFIRLKNAVIGVSYDVDFAKDTRELYQQIHDVAKQIDLWNLLIGRLVGSSTMPSDI
jgi:uncharacterized protein (TIGR02453 family)